MGFDEDAARSRSRVRPRVWHTHTHVDRTLYRRRDVLFSPSRERERCRALQVSIKSFLETLRSCGERNATWRAYASQLRVERTPKDSRPNATQRDPRRTDCARPAQRCGALLEMMSPLHFSWEKFNVHSGARERRGAHLLDGQRALRPNREKESFYRGKTCAKERECTSRVARTFHTLVRDANFVGCHVHRRGLLRLRHRHHRTHTHTGVLLKNLEKQRRDTSRVLSPKDVFDLGSRFSSFFGASQMLGSFLFEKTLEFYPNSKGTALCL